MEEKVKSYYSFQWYESVAAGYKICGVQLMQPEIPDDEGFYLTHDGRYYFHKDIILNTEDEARAKLKELSKIDLYEPDSEKYRRYVTSDEPITQSEWEAKVSK